jgi:tetratricopeptide (TPR) repeat protein
METSLDSVPLTHPHPPTRAVNPFGFTHRYLPWVIAAAFLVLYGVTLGKWVSYQGLPTLARAAGWDWQLAYHAPLHYLLTYPVRWLPAGWQVVGLNSFSMLCAVLTLAILARSVAILPHDRTRDQRQLERNEFALLGIPGAWLPPVFAVLVCGLQLTFWEHATVSTLEALDLLLFAYCIRCLLEYRLHTRDAWIYRMAFVLGLGITSNFAMIGFLPGFLVALIWIKKRSFFNVRFLAKAALLGLAGLLLYLVLPAVNAGSPLTDQSFWEILLVNLGYQKAQLMGFPRYILLVVGLTSLFPIAFMGIRWPNSLGDVSALGNVLTDLMTHVIHAVFLGACIYVAFDPPFSPRQLTSGPALLSFYYLGALSVGYFAGYFMLVFSQTEFKRWHRNISLRKILNRTVVALVWLAALAVPIGLAVKNFPELRKNTGAYFGQMAAKTADSLPESGGIVFSDDPYRLYAVHDALSRRGLRDRFVLLDTTAMHNPAYQRFLRHRYGERWKIAADQLPLNRAVDTATILQTALNASVSQRLFYLHPSFGYFFEWFYLEPRNLAYEMKRYPTNSVTAPRLTPDQVAAGERYWKQLVASELPALRQPSIVDLPKFEQKTTRRNPSTFVPASMYSRALTWFGVEAQRAGQLDLAGDLFKSALEFNPDNPSALLNREYNAVLRQGKTELILSQAATNRITAYAGNWQQMMNFHGPFDEPGALFGVAQVFATGRSFRQASQYLTRAAELLPDSLDLRIALAGTLVHGNFPAQALQLIEQIRSDPKNASMPDWARMALIQHEAWAHVFKDDLATAEKVLVAAEKQYPKDETPFSTLTEIYFRIGRTSNAVALLERELARAPDHVGALVNLAAVKIQNKDDQGAVTLLDRVIKIDPDNGYALINRAIANLHLNRLDDARRDYEALARKMLKVPHVVHYGLAEIAWRQKLRKAALQHYEDYVKVAPPDTAEYREVQQRIKRLKSGGSI